MEIREAMSRLKDHFRVHDDGRPTPKLDEACRIAYECMEKQLPKKVDAREEYRDFHGRLLYYKGFCPDCGFIVHSYKDKYCPCCTQMLDWSEQS